MSRSTDIFLFKNTLRISYPRALTFPEFVSLFSLSFLCSEKGTDVRICGLFIKEGHGMRFSVSIPIKLNNILKVCYSNPRFDKKRNLCHISPRITSMLLR